MSADNMFKIDPEKLMDYLIKLNTSQSEILPNVSNNGSLVRPEEAGIMLVVFCIWIWSCVLFYIRSSIGQVEVCALPKLLGRLGATTNWY